MSKTYGAPRPELAEQAAWLRRFMKLNGLSQQNVANTLGINQARVHEWLYQHSEMPFEAVKSLREWHKDGGPTPPYWLR